MADATVGVTDPITASNKKVDTSELTVGANTVERQRIVIADDAVAANKLIINSDGSLNVQSEANTAGGTSTFSALGGTGNALLTNAAIQVAGGAHSLYGVAFWNPNTVDVWVQIFDVLHASVTLGTTVPKMSIRVPAGNGIQAGSWEEKFLGESKVAFATEISAAATTTATGNTAPTTGVQAQFVYK